ncbi:MAG: MoaD/ThiS family protein [Methanomassiliicoccales archaeon]|nr:MoaD/ThiS family protein [Methanomassiliicoccales archaeon]
MNVKVKLFARYRELAKVGEESIVVTEGARVSDVVAAVLSKHPVLNRQSDEMLVSLNRKRSRGEERVKEGDEVALLPPATGG